MNKCSGNGRKNEISAPCVKGVQLGHYYSAYIGMDVHKDTIAISIAQADREPPRYFGEIANRPEAVAKELKRLNQRYQDTLLLFCYEAGPCGYHLYRQLQVSGHHVQVVAPSLIPKKSGVRIKTDRRDSMQLSSLLRAGELTPVWVPDHDTEAMRDLFRARDDMKIRERKARQQLNAWVLRHGHAWPTGKQRWTKAYYSWLEQLRFDHDWQYVLLHEYTDAVVKCTRRVDSMTEQLKRVLPQWSLAPVVSSLMALRGVDVLSATGLLAELGDLTRFDNPSQLMAYVGVVPSMHASGDRARSGPITKTGNRIARRLLVECAWSYRHPARRTPHLKRKAAYASDYARNISWKAQKRLCTRYRTMTEANKNTKKVNIAIARELVGFIWDIACHEMQGINLSQA